jgi:hypothetical protein
VIRVEVQLPPVVHEVPVTALERWGKRAREKQELLKRAPRSSS